METDTIGVYGRKETFADACVTVTEFLDNLYDQGGNYNQAFLEFERRLQEYFGYQPRDTENCPEDSSADVEFVVYHDGLEWGRYATEEAAEAAVLAYTGEHSVWYECVPAGLNDGDDLGRRKARAHYMAAIRCLCPNLDGNKMQGVQDAFAAFCRDVKTELGGDNGKEAGCPADRDKAV